MGIRGTDLIQIALLATLVSEPPNDFMRIPSQATCQKDSNTASDAGYKVTRRSEVHGHIESQVQPPTSWDAGSTLIPC